MRIVHLVHYYPPEFRGGTEACVESLVAAQTARGDEPQVVCGSDERCEAGDVVVHRHQGVDVHRVRRRPGENFSMDDRLPRVGQAVVDLVVGLRPDAVHLHHALNLSGDMARRLAAAGLPVTATLHDFTMVCARHFLTRPDGSRCAESFPLPSQRCVECVLPDFPAGREALEIEMQARQQTSRAEAAAMGAAIAPSQFVASRWVRSGLFAPGVLSVVPHGVVGAAARPAPARSREDGRLVLATWGHLAPAKGVADLLAALRLLDEERVALIVLGEPTDRIHGEELAAAAADLPVEFRGAYDAGDIAALRGAADLAVFPSRAEESFGLVVAEARALGFPVLASDRGALGELLGEGGACVPAADPDALAEALRALLDAPERLAEWAAAPTPQILSPAAHAERVAERYAQAAGRT